jgi:hypothetical protein
MRSFHDTGILVMKFNIVDATNTEGACTGTSSETRLEDRIHLWRGVA